MTKDPNYDLAAILDDSRHGVEPSESYMRAMDMLDNTVRHCMYVSRGYAGIPSPTSRHFYASVLFTALITRGVTLAQVMPLSPWNEKKIDHWDYASVAGIVRTMIELRIAFYYLCVDVCSEDEWNCRWNIFNLHDCTTRIRLFEAMGHGDQVQALELQAEDLRDRLRANAYFNTLPSGRRKTLLHGQTAYLFPLEEIAERAEIAKETFRWLYILFSSHVHGLPMSFYRIGLEGDDRGRGLPSPVEEGYTSICLSLATTLLVATRDELESMFSDFKARADERIARESAAAQEAIEAPAPAAGMKVGETRTLTETDDVLVEVTLLSDDEVELKYRHKTTGDVVLRRVDSEVNGATLAAFDYAYWNVLLNNQPTTERELELVLQGEWYFRIDHLARTLHFKAGKAS